MSADGREVHQDIWIVCFFFYLFLLFSFFQTPVHSQ